MSPRYWLLALVLSSLFASPVLVEAADLQPTMNIPQNTVQIDSQLTLELSKRYASPVFAEDKHPTAILEFTSELTQSEVEEIEESGVIFERRGKTLIHVGRVYSAQVTDLFVLHSLAEFGLQRATSGSKKFYPSITSSIPAIKAPEVWNNLENDGGSINGTGVTVAVIDTGAEWLHPSFWRQSSGVINIIEDNSEFYADIDEDTIADSNEGPINSIESSTSNTIDPDTDYFFIDTDNDDRFEYGNGDRWLGGIDANDDGIISLPSEDVVILGESKVAFLYDQENDDVYVRGVNLTTDALAIHDYNGHGSHIASVIAGGQQGFTSMIGAAPGADLIIIRSPLESSDIIDGISFAVENDADIINMSFSSYLGYLDGTDLEDLAVSEAFRNYGVLTTLAAGNLGGRSKHAYFSVSSGGTAGTTLSVHSPPLYSFLNIIWSSEDDDEHVFLAPPAGESIDLGAFADMANTAQELTTPDLNAYVFYDESKRGTNRIVVQISTDDHNWTSGTWTVSVENPSGDAINVNAYAWDNTWTGTTLRFSSQVSSLRTISSPGTADLGITVTSYDEGANDISSSSSVGPRIDGAPKPTVAAPGVSIRAASRLLTSLWTVRSGTSMASPHVAGLLALIRQAAGDSDGWKDYSALIQGAGGINNHFDTALNDWGHGLSDALWSVQHILNLSLDTTSDISDWEGVPLSTTDSIDTTIFGEHDITSVRSYVTLETLVLAVGLRSMSDFTGENVLNIEWDEDDNPSTGANGVDLIINVTSSTVSVFEWIGSSFQTSSIMANWWNVSSTVFVSIERINPGIFGKLSVSTHNLTHSSIDTTITFDLYDYWRPIVNSLELSANDDELDLDLQLTDRDSVDTEFTISWSITSGDLTVVHSDDVQDQNNLDLLIEDMAEQPWYIASEMMSILLEIDVAGKPLILPPIGLSTEVGLSIGIASASLESEIIRIGPLIEEHLKGQIIVTGYTFVDTVQLGLKASYGLWLNFTLTGTEGVYPIDIILSGFSPGEYEVYAIIVTPTGDRLESNFATINVVEDYTNFLFVTIPAIAVILITMFVLKMRRRNPL